MTQDDILKMAVQAGFTWEPIGNLAGPLERFAELVTAAKQPTVKKSLTAQPEPVAWLYQAADPDGWNQYLEWTPTRSGYYGEWKRIPLYTCPPELWRLIDENQRLRAELKFNTQPEAEREAIARVIGAARGLLTWIEFGYRPPVRDQIEAGRMVRVRLHALADLHDAIVALGSAA